MNKETVVVELFSILEATGIADLVSRDFLTVKDVPANVKKAIMVIEEDSEDDIRYTSSDFADVEFTVTLICYVRTEKNMASEMTEFDRKIKAALGSNRKLNGKAFSSQIVPLVDKEIRGNQGLFTRPIRIQYEGSVTDGL